MQLEPLLAVHPVSRSPRECYRAALQGQAGQSAQSGQHAAFTAHAADGTASANASNPYIHSFFMFASSIEGAPLGRAPPIGAAEGGRDSAVRLLHASDSRYDGGMRILSVVLVLGLVTAAVAQEAPAQQPYPIVDGATATPPPPPAPPPPPTLTAPTLSVHARPPASAVSRWKGARTLYVFGGVVGLLSTGLSLASSIYVLATGYPPDADDFVHPAKPSDPGPVMAYVGSGASALGFAMSAGGLGWQHRILDDLGADPGRGYFISGTVIGLLGIVAVGAGYFIGLTDYLSPHDQSIAALATSLGGSALCTTGSALFAKDSSRLKKTWKMLTTF